MFKMGDKVKLHYFSDGDTRFKQFVNEVGEIIGVLECGRKQQFIRVSYGKGKQFTGEHRGDYIDVGCWRLKKIKISA